MELTPLHQLLMRLLPSLVGVALCAVFIAIWHHSFPAYVALVGWFDATANRPPFGDLSSILMAGECARKGANVFVANPCMGGGTFNYSPFMLRSILPLFSVVETNMLGLCIAAMFFLACACLPPVRDVCQLAVRIFAICSGIVMYVLEAGNFDAVIFIVLTVALLLQPLRSGISLAAYLLFAVTAAWKFYPVVLLSLVIRERGWRLALAVAALLASGILFLWHFGEQSHAALETLPAGLPFRGSFSVMNIPFGVALLAFLPRLTLDPDKVQYFTAIGAPHFANYVVVGAWTLVGLLLLGAWRVAPVFIAPLERLDAPRRLFLLAGALLISFCYCMAQNYDYRGIFLLFALPGLQEMGARGTGRNRMRFLGMAALVLLWEAPLRQAASQAVGPLGQYGLYIRIGLWLARECLWWGLNMCFVAIAFAALRTGLHGLLNGRVVRLHEKTVP